MMLQPHNSWNIKDPSKLSTYLDCPRKYFYQYMLGWRSEVPSHDAYFGECWHIAREHMLLNSYDDVIGAYNAFMNHYEKQYDLLESEIFRPKTPEGAVYALANFAAHYHRDLIDNKVLYTEIAGRVPVDDHRSLSFRMDSIIEQRSDGKIFSWDHKTTSAKRLAGRFWEDEFYLSLQNGCYTHCMYCMFPIDLVKGVEFCGTGFEYLSRGSKLKTQGYNVSFKRVPAWKTPDQMNVWLWLAKNTLDEIEFDTERLMDCHEGDLVLQAFPQRPGTCTKYFGCEFHDYCISWSNPLQHCFEPPIGFTVDHWDPNKRPATNIMELEWKGE